MVTTKERILELRQQDPEIKAVRISEQLSISKEAVRQQLVKLDIPTNFWLPTQYCIDCGIPLGYHSYYSPKNHRCRACWNKSHHTTLTCEGCGVTYSLILSQAQTRLRRNKHHFCSRRCLGKWLGTNYGFKRKVGLDK